MSRKITLTKEIREKIKQKAKYLDSSKTVNGNEIVDLYNEVFGADAKTGRLRPYTGCGSCLRNYLKELKFELEKWTAIQKEKMAKCREAKANKVNNTENNGRQKDTTE